MKEIIATLLLLIAFYVNLFSQNQEQDTIFVDEKIYIVFIPPYELESEIERYFKAQHLLIKLKVHPQLVLDSISYSRYALIIDSLQSVSNFEIIDSASVSLTSGLSWNLYSSPPKAPVDFYLKVLTKNGRTDKAVLDRLKYLQFCHAWNENGKPPTDLVDRFNTYHCILIDNIKVFQMAFELRFNENETKDITSKEVIFH